MFQKYLTTGALGTLAMVWALSAQSPLQTAVNNSLKAMGVVSVKTLTIMGDGGDGAVGQQLDAKADKWRWYADKNVILGYDFDAKAFRTQRTRGEGNVPPGGGNGTTTPAPTAPQDTVTQANNFNGQIEMAMTPVGFLKMAAEKNATVSQKTVKGQKYTVLSFPMESGAGPGAYKTMVNGYIDDKNMVQKVETTISHEFLGDIPWTAEFLEWKDFGGVKFPTHIVQRQGDPMIYELMVTDVKLNQPVDLAPAGRGGAKGGAAPGGAVAKGGPGGGKGAPGGAPGGPAAAKGGVAPGGGRGGAAAVVDSEDLGGGCYLIRGGYAAVLCDMKDFVMMIEGTANDGRVDDVLAESRKLFPTKPIKWVINTHDHFDHSTGLRAAVASGMTIITYKGNKGLYEKVMANPHMLVPDKLAKMNPKPKLKIEYVGEKKVYKGGTNIVETYHLQGSSHNLQELIIYLPKQKVLVEADEFNVLTPTPTAPIANPNSYQVNLLQQIQNLKLDVDRIVPIHLPNDNHRVTLQELKWSAGKQ